MSAQEPNNTDIIFYSSLESYIRVEVVYEEETFWLSQKRMAELFGVEVNTINYSIPHLGYKNPAGVYQYGKFRVIQDKTFESDFEKEAKRLKGRKE